MKPSWAYNSLQTASSNQLMIASSPLKDILF